MENNTSTETNPQNKLPKILIALAVIAAAVIYMSFKGYDFYYKRNAELYFNSMKDACMGDTEYKAHAVSRFYDATLYQSYKTSIKIGLTINNNENQYLDQVVYPVAALNEKITGGNNITKIGKLKKIKNFKDEPAYETLSSFYENIGTDVKITGLAEVKVQFADDLEIPIVMYQADKKIWSVYDMTLSRYVVKNYENHH